MTNFNFIETSTKCTHKYVRHLQDLVFEEFKYENFKIEEDIVFKNNLVKRMNLHVYKL